MNKKSKKSIYLILNSCTLSIFLFSFVVMLWFIIVTPINIIGAFMFGLLTMFANTLYDISLIKWVKSK